MTALATDLERRLARAPYQGYAYAYPHKTAYRPFPEPRPLRDLWAKERRDSLFLYMHVPFCEFRCGFCNLFTHTNPGEGLVARFLDTLARQVDQAREALGDASFARFAIGGGTPTQLEPRDLARLFDLAQSLGADSTRLPVSIEFSPDTTTPDRVAVLKERALDRASIGVQSFFEDEARAAGRPQKTATVHRALTLLREAGFPTLNIDLIYGLPGQTAETWRASLEQALRYRPEELFLYPLYVRPLTGLGRRELARADDLRPALYEHARELLLASGYTQVSMRLFRIASAPDTSGPAYCCQEDGMLGLGCGARSYTRSVHYASDYAVGAKGVKAILADWVGRTDAQLAAADLGFVLDGEDQRRRYAIQSLLWKSGLVLSDYRRRFGTDALDDLPQLAELEPLGLAACSEDDAAEDGEDTLRLTPEGLAMSDVLGPWLNSAKVAALMESYEAS